MKTVAVFACSLLMLSLSANAQSTPKLDYFTKVPANIQSCGALYTCDTVTLQKKKYLLLTDFQNLGLVTINGRQVKLQLTATKTSGKINTSTYTGGSYTIILSASTTARKGQWDMESGSLQIINGSKKTTVKIHGQSHCDESKQEGNL